MLHVAVVCRGQEKPQSGGTNGGWSSFIGVDRDDVVSRALKHAESRSPNMPAYVVLVGTLDQQAQAPVSYQLVPLPALPEHDPQPAR